MGFWGFGAKAKRVLATRLRKRRQKQQAPVLRIQLANDTRRGAQHATIQTTSRETLGRS